jgi:hypothetical protein
MPMLEIIASKKVTAIITLEDATAKQVDQYAAMTKGSADDVIEAALSYIFSKDRDFVKYREENAAAKPVIPLRMKRPSSNGTKLQQQPNGAGNGAAPMR